MNKVDVVGGLAERTGLTKRDAERAVNAFCDLVQEAVGRGDKVSLLGFGTFEARERAARQGRNPQTGQSIDIPAGRVPVFKAGKGFKDAVER